MRILFVSGTIVGGSGRSQRELAQRLGRFGHDVHFLVDDGRPARLRRWWYEQLSDLAVRLSGRRGSGIVRAFERRPGRRTGTRTIDGIVHRTTPVPQNAFEDALAALRPDVVVANSVERLSWRRCLAACRARALPAVLYVREAESLDHLTIGDLPDAAVANAASLAGEVTARGIPCTVIPSVIDTETTRTASTRRTALAVNPIPTRGVDLVWRIAAAAPEIPFVLQESWPLDERQLAEVRARVDAAPNVELRRVTAPGPHLYGDARVLLVPYRVNNRPRVVAEAQANGIPVLAARVPAILEAMGDGGVALDLDDTDAWVAALRRLWSDGEHYERLAAAALEHSRREDIEPDRVARRFEAVLLELVERARTLDDR